MPFPNQKSRAAYFEKLKQSGATPKSGLASGISGSSTTGSGSMPPGMPAWPTMGKIQTAVPNQVKPAISMNNGLVPTPAPQTPNPLNIMKAKSPHLKNVKFPKLKKFL
jgi:hypothetical protein